ncbi:N-acetylmuramoyl-L-alanine amidase [Prevotella sp. DNF00663]|uniref:N-acetylmuramoyl-L-alanine amidase family protein n=1 Tax=Prevotella sp. DNF00663 TaxID=1384078 RepID=UPI000785DFC6|nr:N-acetylmuramoyl-L-alanine amidase [Prevotella sp. DNF00663]KXB80866.1 N-acetylmuramoyl-L-alanine amidase [Prevotella sp. DNF00663]
MINKKILFSLITLLLVAITSNAANRRFTLVIDPGHGGHDTGAMGAFSKEKDINLTIALAFGKLVERSCPDVKVVYTRRSDVFIPLKDRADIANRNKADLFVSVHTNALPGGHIARGFQTYTLGSGRASGSKRGIVQNLEVAKRENAVIYLEKDYRQTYQGFDPNSSESNIMYEFIQDKNMEQSVALAKLMQRNVCSATGRADMGAHQDNLAVLRLSSMPSCLLELGFISTPDEEQFLNTADAVDRYAKGIFNAFVAYKSKYYGGDIVVPYKVTEPVKSTIPNIVPDQYKESETPVPAVEPVQETDNRPVFKVQVLTSGHKLSTKEKTSRGLEDADFYQENNTYKYTYGASNDYNEINRLRIQLRDKFPEAFVIAFKGDMKMDVREAIKEFKQNK